MDKEKKIIIKNENNEEKEYYILATFDIEERNKSYVLYTDYSKDENGKVKVYASIYGAGNKLSPVIEKDECEVIDKYIKSIDEDIKLGIKFE